MREFLFRRPDLLLAVRLVLGMALFWSMIWVSTFLFVALTGQLHWEPSTVCASCVQS